MCNVPTTSHFFCSPYEVCHVHADEVSHEPVLFFTVDISTEY
jgi:hypothetical protein